MQPILGMKDFLSSFLSKDQAYQITSVSKIVLKAAIIRVIVITAIKPLILIGEEYFMLIM